MSLSLPFFVIYGCAFQCLFFQSTSTMPVLSNFLIKNCFTNIFTKNFFIFKTLYLLQFFVCNVLVVGSFHQLFLKFVDLNEVIIFQTALLQSHQYCWHKTFLAQAGKIGLKCLAQRHSNIGLN